MQRIARLAPRPRSQQFAALVAGAGLAFAIGLGLILPAALSFAGL